MQETPQQYVQRMLRLIEGKKPLEILGTTPRKVAALVKGVTRKKLGARPQPDKWSVTEILAHLADVEIVQGVRLRMILESSGRPIQGFDQDAWARYSDYAHHDAVLSFEAYKVNRERNLRLLKSIPSAMWENHGVHSERGKETVRRVTEMMAGHDINHLEQIRRILKGT